MGYGRNYWQATSVTRWRQASDTTLWCRGTHAKLGLDHRAGHPIFCGLTHSSSRRTEGRRRYLDRCQYGGKHRPGLLPEKPLRGCRPIRACEQEIVDSREACTTDGAKALGERLALAAEALLRVKGGAHQPMKPRHLHQATDQAHATRTDCDPPHRSCRD